MTEQTETPEAPDTSGYPWYVAQARPGYEKRVQENIRTRAVMHNISGLIGEIAIPSETVITMKDGQKKKSEQKLFPGYVLVQVKTDYTEDGLPVMDSDAWHCIRETAHVVGFVGAATDRSRPRPITDEEAERIAGRLRRKEGGAEIVVSPFEPGEEVLINEGPFAGFTGVVRRTDASKGVVEVSILVFGREMGVEIGNGSVEKASARQ